MGKSFKKIFLGSARKIILLFFGLGVSGILLLPQPASAQLWDKLLGGLTFVPNNIINVFFQFVLLFSAAAAALAGAILKWVLSPGFISWGYVDNNPVVQIGLGITKSFVNMGLVLVLIFIAFGIILRLKEYEAKKTLSTLIIVALLVNFAPVICGFIVDASNIAMYYFTDNLTGMQNLTDHLKSMSDNIAASIRTLRATEQFEEIFSTGVMIAFTWATFFILIIYAFLFLFRYVAIWTAVILAPLAFVSRILPSTSFWNTWWRQFTQWCIIGIPAAFFLYLGERIASDLAPTALIEGMGAEYGWMDSILPHFVTLAFLIMGLMVAFSTSAWGAGRIMEGGRKIGRNGPAFIFKTAPRIAKKAPRIASGISRITKPSETSYKQTYKQAYQAARQRGWSKRKATIGATKKTGQSFARTARTVAPQPPPQGYKKFVLQGLDKAWKTTWDTVVVPPKKKNKKT